MNAYLQSSPAMPESDRISFRETPRSSAPMLSGVYESRLAEVASRNYLLSITQENINNSSFNLWSRWPGMPLVSFTLREPLDYFGDPSYYAAKFVPVPPNPIIPKSEKCSCEEFLAKKPPVTIELHLSRKKRNELGRDRCEVKISCRDMCPKGDPGYTEDPVNIGRIGVIEICISNKVNMINDFERIYKHEMHHAEQFCKGNYIKPTFVSDPDGCKDCRKDEAEAHRINCEMAFEGDTTNFNRCVACGVYYSCRSRMRCGWSPLSGVEQVSLCDSWADVGLILENFPPPK